MFTEVLGCENGQRSDTRGAVIDQFMEKKFTEVNNNTLVAVLKEKQLQTFYQFFQTLYLFSSHFKKSKPFVNPASNN